MNVINCHCTPFHITAQQILENAADRPTEPAREPPTTEGGRWVRLAMSFPSPAEWRGLARVVKSMIQRHNGHCRLHAFGGVKRVYVIVAAIGGLRETEKVFARTKQRYFPAKGIS